ASAWITSPFRNAWNGITGYGELKEANSRLRDRLPEAEAGKATEANAAEQLRRLNDQLNLGIPENLPTQIARVTSGQLSNFGDYRVEIDKGSDAGLAKGMPVVTNAGDGKAASLVGRLERVSSTRSLV